MEIQEGDTFSAMLNVVRGDYTVKKKRVSPMVRRALDGSMGGRAKKRPGSRSCMSRVVLGIRRDDGILGG